MKVGPMSNKVSYTEKKFANGESKSYSLLWQV